MIKELSKILPQNLLNSIKNLDFELLQELRLRANCPVVVKYNSKLFYLGINGLVNNQNQGYFVDTKLIENVVLLSSNNSIYSVSEQIKNGFLTTNGGIRLGIAGEVVYENSRPKTLKNFQSLNIRIPHQVLGCSKSIFHLLLDEQNNFKNTLVLSVPGAGKTTFIRDICYQLSNGNLAKNVLIIDERGEICNSIKGNLSFQFGAFVDCISFCSKQYGFENGIRSLAPDIVVTDEIANENDCLSLEYLSNCGVKILATTHCANISELKSKFVLKSLVENKVFERFVVLSSRMGVGTIEGVYEQNLNQIWSCND